MKRMVASLATLLILCVALLPSAHARVRTMGDVNGDGVVTASDAAMTLRAAAGRIALDAASAAIADATGNMLIGDGDASAILLLCTGRVGSFEDIDGAALLGLLGERYMERFSYTGVISDVNEYRSDRVSVTFSSGTQGDFVYHLADIYVRSAESIATAFGGDAYGAAREPVLDMAKRAGAVVAINGDGYSSNRLGPLVRNGFWYRDSVDPDTDVCVLYRNGKLVTYAAGRIDAVSIDADDPAQTWTGGPRLLNEEGVALTSFACERSLLSRSARTMIGYYEPGHYCFVCVDGKQNPASEGASMTDLALLAEALGCKAAYHLQGGNSSVMTTQTALINTARDGGRDVADAILVCEPKGTQTP